MLSPVFRGLVYHMIMQRHGYCMWVASNRKIVVIICVKSTQTLWLVKLATYKLWVSKPQITFTLFSKGHLTATYHNIIICIYRGPIAGLVISMKCPAISWNVTISWNGQSLLVISFNDKCSTIRPATFGRILISKNVYCVQIKSIKGEIDKEMDDGPWWWYSISSSNVIPLSDSAKNQKLGNFPTADKMHIYQSKPFDQSKVQDFLIDTVLDRVQQPILVPH